MQDDAEEKEPRSGPCKGRARKISDDVSAHQRHNYVHDSNVTETDGMRALAGDAEHIAVLAQIN